MNVTYEINRRLVLKNLLYENSPSSIFCYSPIKQFTKQEILIQLVSLLILVAIDYILTLKEKEALQLFLSREQQHFLLIGLL